MRPGRSLLICTNPRSGSWLLAKALEATGVAGRPQEYFRADYEPRFRRLWGLPESGPYQDFIEKLLAAATTPNAVLCVKTHFHQFRSFCEKLQGLPGNQTLRPHEAVARYLPDLRYVHLYRYEVVTGAVSWFRAQRTGDWWHISGQRSPAGGRELRADFQHISWLERRLRVENQAWMKYFREAGIRPLYITYDDLEHQYEASVLKVLAHVVDVQPDLQVPPPYLEKQADHRNRRWVLEYLDYKRSRAAGPRTAAAGGAGVKA